VRPRPNITEAEYKGSPTGDRLAIAFGGMLEEVGVRLGHPSAGQRDDERH
jgi:hypothetical protein